ncbi:putative polyketide synthase [Nemania sp. FL0031]|nr:putative polyketide synthase [Nemania sp. FL0031]
MYHIPVFAGLGSDTLFTPSTSEQAIRDASLPESQIVLEACYAIFREQIKKATERDHPSALAIDLTDFLRPDALLQPHPSYHQNVVIQHTTIYLLQILRYIGHGYQSLRIQGAVGFCTGLLPAAAVSTTSNTIGFLQRVQELFIVAFWAGMNSDLYRRNEILRSGCDPELPWAIVVDRLSKENIASLITASSESNGSALVYVSAKNSVSCITLSGRGDHLATFASKTLPSQCRTRPTNVLTLYHHREILHSVFQQTLNDIKREMSLGLDVVVTSSAPLFSTRTGEPMGFSGHSKMRNTLGELVTKLLEMMLLEPVDWVKVQDSVLNYTRQITSAPSSILNFGPGYGISRFSEPMPKLLEIRDVSAASTSRLQGTGDSSPASPDDIAIVGLAVELPDAQDALELWENLLNGIPSTRFYIDDFYLKENEDGGKAKRSIGTRYGNFLRNPFLFDNELFDISPREAKSIDPQQRVLLQTAYRALENAGYVPDSTPSFARDTFGCFVGNATLDYVDNLRSDIDVYYSPGTLRAFQSGRISYYFGWSGPSMTLDTACSSSMVAMHQAARALQSGDCRAALVGGVNVITSPDMYLGLDRAHFLSPTGQCKAFDASADGYSRSEGCGVFIVKTMRDALAEGDRIHGIIKGIEVNQSGNAHSITHPHAPTQEQLFRKLLAKTKVNPHKITVVETHGTGTQAGDPNEVASLRRVVCDNRDPQNVVHFTSIKANIGHCEAASGLAALAKIVLMMKHETIPPQISLTTLNPRIQELGTDGAVIDTVATQWVQPNKQPKLALINNFGAAGSNAALILQEHVPRHTGENNRRHRTDSQTYVLGLSAKSSKSLEKLRQDLVAMLVGPLSVSISMGDVCYTATARRQLYDYRLSVTAATIPELAQNLKVAEASRLQMSKKADPPIVFVFSGQGAQYLGMGRQLLSMYPLFSDTIHRCDRILRSNGFPGCLDIIQLEEAMLPDPEDLLQLQSFQSAIFALEVALSQLLISWNILPQAVIGHSLGEYAALVTAGVLDLDSGLLLVAHRAQLMMRNCDVGSTSMLAANIGAADARAIIESDKRFISLAIACDNSPGDCVIGGPVPSLEALKDHLTKHGGTRSKFLDVPLAYHTEAMDPIMDDLTQYAATLHLRKPTLTVISNVFGRAVSAGEDVFNASYFASHSRQTVAFQEGLGHFLCSFRDSATAHWIEVGPHASLLSMIASQAPQAKSRLLPCLRKGVSPSSTLSQLLSHFYLSSSLINWRQVFAFTWRPNLTDLPILPFHQSEFVAGYPHEEPMEPKNDAPVPTSTRMFLGQPIQLPSKSNRFSSIHETAIQPLRDLITGHIVCGYALCPASVYHQMALSAVQQAEAQSVGDFAFALTNVSYVTPLLYMAQSNNLIRTHVSLSSQGGYNFTISSYIDGSDPDLRSVTHCKGHIKRKPKKSVLHKALLTERILERQINRFIQPEPSILMETFSTKAMYSHVFTRVVTYSGIYQQVQSIRISPEYDEAYARCKFGGLVHNQEEAGSIFMDVLLHVAGFVANLTVESDEVGICKEVSSALVLRQPAVEGAYFDVHCSLFTLPDKSGIVADAKAVDKHGIMAVFKGMIFQRAKLSGINRAFSLQSKKTQDTSSYLPSRNTISAVQKLGPGGLSHTIASPVPAPPVEETGHIIRRLVAEACGLGVDAPSAGTTTLKELGFDSLLQIELEAQLLSAFPQLDIGALPDCETIADIENLALGQISNTPPSLINGLDTSEATSDDGVPDIQQLTRTVIAETCSGDINTITSSSELSALGIDSLMVFELESSLTKISKRITISTAELAECLTVGDVEKLVSFKDKRLRRTENGLTTLPSPSMGSTSPFESTSQTAVPTPIPSHSFSPSIATFLNPHIIGRVAQILKLEQQPEVIQSELHDASRAPLFLIHDGSGICTHYRRLGPLGRPVYALHDPKFIDPFASWAKIDDMVKEYCRIITSTTRGPYLLGGWSFGGVVAFEVARRLKKLGHAVIGAVLIDAPPPINHQPLSSRLIDAVVEQDRQPSTETGKAIQALVRRSFTACASLLRGFSPYAIDELPAPNLYFLRSREGWKYPNDCHAITDVWIQDRSNPRMSVEGWEQMSQSRVLWEDIPGDHFRVFDRANVDTVTNAIKRVSFELETSFSNNLSTS